MSRFVPAGAEPSTEAIAPNNDAWAKAREQIEAARKSKSVESGKQEDGRSLYEVLQANKAAKQEAFEEASKLRNQFRPLDESEIEFLDSVRESERRKEETAKQEASEQLDEFRKRRSEAEREARQRELDDQTTSGSKGGGDKPGNSGNSWIATKKRRRVVEADEELPAPKTKVASLLPQTETKEPPAITASDEGSDDGRTAAKHRSSVDMPASDANAPNQPAAGLGLNAYDSDDDD